MEDWVATLIKWLGVGILVFLNGFFVAAEFALVKARESRLKQLAQKQRFGASVGLHILKHINAYLSACQLGITLASLGLGWLGEKALAEFFVPLLDRSGVGSTAVHMTISAALMFMVITFLHIVVGEQAPKVFAIQKPEATTLWVAWPLKLFYHSITPAIWLLNTASLGLLKLVGLRPMDEHEGTPTAEELRSILQQTSKNDQLTPVAGSLLLNAFDLRRRRARQVMIHRTKVVFLSTQRTLEENLKNARLSGYSRFPLCEGDVDQIVGMVHLKDLMWLYQDEGGRGNILSIKRDVLFVPETMALERLLNAFLTKRIHMAVLVDEYGTIVGMVTLENILEEIVGDIQDEFDQESLMFQKISDTEFRAQGELPLHDLEELIGVHLTAEDVTTLSGFVIEQLGRVPQPGESVEVEGHEFTAIRVSGHRVVHVGIRKLQSETPDLIAARSNEI